MFINGRKGIKHVEIKRIKAKEVRKNSPKKITFNFSVLMQKVLTLKVRSLHKLGSF